MNKVLVGGSGVNKDPEKYFTTKTEKEREDAAKAYFSKGDSSRLTNKTYATNTAARQYNPYSYTMPIDPATGAPKHASSYLTPGAAKPDYEGASKKMLEDYTAAVTAVPYRSPSQPQMQSTTDYIKRIDKTGLPALGLKTDPASYSYENNRNFLPFKYDPRLDDMPLTTMPIFDSDDGGGGGSGAGVGGYAEGGMVQNFADGGQVALTPAQQALYDHMVNLPAYGGNHSPESLREYISEGNDASALVELDWRIKSEARQQGATKEELADPKLAAMRDDGAATSAYLAKKHGITGPIHQGMGVMVDSATGFVVPTDDPFTIDAMRGGKGLAAFSNLPDAPAFKLKNTGTAAKMLADMPAADGATTDGATMGGATMGGATTGGKTVEDVRRQVQSIIDNPAVYWMDHIRTYNPTKQLKEGEEYVAPSKTLRESLLHKMDRGVNALNEVSHLIAQKALSDRGFDPSGMSYAQMEQALHRITPSENYRIVTDADYSKYKKPVTTTIPTTPPKTPPKTGPGKGPGTGTGPGTVGTLPPIPDSTYKPPTSTYNPFVPNPNLNPGFGVFPPGFNYDPSKYFGTSPAQRAIAANPNLTPTGLGLYNQTTDRLGNVIAIPTLGPLTFQPFTPPVKRAEGGLVEDDDDREASGAKQMLKGYEKLTGPRETRVTRSPNAQSVRTKQTNEFIDKQGRPAGMSMSYESMSTAQGPSQASPEQVATAKARLSDLMRQNLSKQRFAEGGDVSNFKRGASDKKGAPAKAGKEPEAEKEPEEPGFFDIMDYSAKASTKMFPKQKGADDQRDAARHMMAAALVTKKLGPGMAEFLGKAHERMSNPMSFFNMIGIGEPRYDYPVDLHNNKLGIDLASKSKSQGELEKLVEALSKTSSNEQQPGRPWTVAPEVVQAIMAKQKKMAETPPEYRAEGSPEEGEGYVKPSNPFGRQAEKQAKRRAEIAERSRIAEAREKVARTPALDEAGGETTDEFIQRTMGLDPSVNEQRGTFLPQRIKRNGKSEWIAPSIVKDAVMPYALSSQALTTNRFNEEDVPKAAMNIGAAGLALGKAPAGALASNMRKGAAEAPASIFSPIPSAEAPFVGRLDQFAASMPGVARKDQLLGQLKGKFRDYEMGRAQEALKDLDDAAKISPSDFLNRLKQVDDPARYRTQVVEPEEGKFYRSMDNPWQTSMEHEGVTIPPPALGVIHLIHDKLPEVGIRIDNLKKLISDLNAQASTLTWFASSRSVDKLTDEIIPRVIQAIPKDDQVNRNYVSSINEALSDIGNKQIKLRELKREIEYPRLSNDYDSAVQEAVTSLRLGNKYELNSDQLDSIKEQIRQNAVAKFNEYFDLYLPEQDRVPAGLDLTLPQNRDKVVDSMGLVKDLFKSEVQTTAQSLLNRVEGLFPEVNQQNSYMGQHGVLRNLPDPISFSRFSEHKATIPGMGKNVQGIYVHELQSDLLDDVRKRGPLSGSAAKDYENLFAPLQQQESELAQEISRLSAQRKQLSPRAGDELRVVNEKIAELYNKANNINTKKNKIRQRMADGTYDMKEAFPGMENSPQVIQQLMAKNAISAAINRGKSFVAFPGAESAQPQLYEKLPNNLKQVVKDLGPGFEVRMIELPHPQSSTDPASVLKNHVAIVWGPEAAARIKKQGVSFKDGGPVDANAEFIKAHA